MPKTENPRDYALVSHPDWAEPLKIDLNRKHERRDIGGSPDCWLTLPDPNLPDVVAKIDFVSHHDMLWELPKANYHRASEIDIKSLRARRIGHLPFTVGDYEIRIYYL